MSNPNRAPDGRQSQLVGKGVIRTAYHGYGRDEVEVADHVHGERPPALYTLIEASVSGGDAIGCRQGRLGGS